MNKYSVWSILMVLFVLLLFFVSLGFVCTHWSNWNVRGTFGDSFGALNALFSGLAFAGLIVTLIMQKDELGMQREELDEAKQELRQQSIEFKKQNKTLNLQRFENTFFNMLNLQETITRNLHYDCPDGGDPFECDGRMVFTKFYTYKELDFDEHIRGVGAYLQCKGLHQYSRVPDIEVFDHYFRHLYRIFKFVNESPLIETEEERYDYACIVRSQLSEYELLMLFYNSLQDENAKFKTLIEKFAVFNNIRREKLASRDSVVKERRMAASVSFRGDTKGFVSEIFLPEDNFVFYSVPADNGFTAYVDGKQTLLYQVNLGLSSVFVPKGKHEVQFKFMPAGMKEGMMASVAMLVILLLVGWNEKIKLRKEI